MDHFQILKRAFGITRSYRALWVFGVLLALTTARSGGSSGGGGGGGGGSNGGQFPPPSEWRIPEVTAVWPEWLTAAIIAGGVLILLMVAVGLLIRYVSETALIGMVDRRETSGETLGVRQGFRLGWSRAAFRLFLIDLMLGLGGILLFLLLLLVAATPFLVWLTRSEVMQVLGTATGIGLVLLVILLGIVVSIALSLLIQLVRRVCVLEGRGVMDSLRRGVRLVRQRLGDILVMGILLFAIGLGFTVLMIPVLIVLVLAGVILGGLPALLVGGIASLVTEGAFPWIAGSAVGLPIFLVVVILPSAFLGGLFEVFKSSAWTLTYREVKALEVLPPESVAGEGAAGDAAGLPA